MLLLAVVDAKILNLYAFSFFIAGSLLNITDDENEEEDDDDEEEDEDDDDDEEDDNDGDDDNGIEVETDFGLILFSK